MLNNPVIPRPIVSREEWLAARRALLAKEKEATRLRDRVNAERLALMKETAFLINTAPLIGSGSCW